jgi:hypothetical protein
MLFGVELQLGCHAVALHVGNATPPSGPVVSARYRAAHARFACVAAPRTSAPGTRPPCGTCWRGSCRPVCSDPSPQPAFRKRHSPAPGLDLRLHPPRPARPADAFLTMGRQRSQRSERSEQSAAFRGAAGLPRPGTLGTLGTLGAYRAETALPPCAVSWSARGAEIGEIGRCGE